METDVLVIGGGLAGCLAAIRASELNAKVTLIDKAFVGRSGCSTFAAGDFLCWMPKDDLNEWLNLLIKSGEWLADPDWIVRILKLSNELAHKIDGWDPTIFEKDEEGQFIRKVGRGNIKSIIFSGYKLMALLRKQCLLRNVQIFDRIVVTDLLTGGNSHVVGAVGFNIYTGEFYMFKAKGTVVATGGCGYRGPFFGMGTSTGDGLAMAFRAGADLISMEYGKKYQGSFIAFNTYGMARFVGIGAKWLNAKGEAFMERYDPELKDRAPLDTLTKAMTYEVRNGRGPIFFDLTGIKREDIKLQEKILPFLMKAFKRAGINPFAQKLEWIPAFTGTMGGCPAGLRINHECATTLSGLFAAGDDASKVYVLGARIGLAGIGITWAAVTGYLAGESAASYALNTEIEIKVDSDTVQALKKYAYVPLARKEGPTPDEIVYKIQEVVIPVENSMIQHHDRLVKALEKLKEIKNEMVSKVKAEDYHELAKAHAAVNMCTIAEATFRASLYRTESRGGHFREDYPERDNNRWLKRVIVRRVNDDMIFLTEPISIEKFSRYGLRY